MGATIQVYSRQLKISDYGDISTRKLFESKQSRTLALIKPDALNNIGKILDATLKSGLTAERMRMVKMTLEQAQSFYAERKGEASFATLSAFLASDVVVAIELVGGNALEQWQQLMGPNDPVSARTSAPNTLRAIFGTDAVKNALHGSDSGTYSSKNGRGGGSAAVGIHVRPISGVYSRI